MNVRTTETGKIDHVSGEHDDRINAGAGALLLARKRVEIKSEHYEVAETLSVDAPDAPWNLFR